MNRCTNFFKYCYLSDELSLDTSFDILNMAIPSVLSQPNSEGVHDGSSWFADDLFWRTAKQCNKKPENSACKLNKNIGHASNPRAIADWRSSVKGVICTSDNTEN